MENNFSGIVFLTGFMGCGKTTIGRHLSQVLNIDFLDLDTEIQIHQGKSITEIFKFKGEKFFREIETYVLRNIPFKKKQIIAVGGGCFVNKENIDFVNSIGTSLFIDVDFETIWERLQEESAYRPLASIQDKNKLKSLYDDRQNSYKLSHKHFTFNKKYTKEEEILHILKLLN